jgi:rare lipoprotein A
LFAPNFGSLALQNTPRGQICFQVLVFRRYLAPADEAGLVTASFYQSGAVTANGEQFRPMGFTAAHRSLKFGTWLKVVNTDNGKSVTVRVNDRGPYVDGRAIDLSLGAALALDMTGEGLAKVQVSVISP